MTGFQIKTISNPLTLGEKLRQFRTEKELSLKEVSRITKVSVKYLTAIEDGRFNDLPGDVYARSFLKVYTKFLGVDTKKFLDLYQSENTIYNKTRKIENDFTKPVEKISRFNLLITPKLFKMALLIVFVVIVLSYLGFKFKAIVTPPILVVENPANNLVTNESFIVISGMVEAEATLEINGQQVLPDSQGYFNETVDLQTGSNTIEIKAEKRHGTKTQIYRQIVVIDDSNN